VETIYLKKVIELPAAPAEALAVIDCDNGYELFVNGKSISSGADFGKPQVVNLKPHLVAGTNVIAVVAQNFSPDMVKPPRQKKPKNPAPFGKAAKRAAAATSRAAATTKDGPNPAGFFFHGTATIADSSGGEARKLIEFDSDASWKWSPSETDDWTLMAFDDAGWKPAADLGPAEIAPWTLTKGLESLKAKFTLRYDHLRAVWARNDAIMSALGRPNRDIAVTHRDSPATMLQLLELTNGATITRIMEEGGKRWAQSGLSGDELATQIYLRALGRKPNDNELGLCRKSLGEKPTAQAVSDLLWSLAMLPEFQLIY
jgi:hypothetical protein